MDDEGAHAQIVSALRSGQVIILPSDTLYGFSALLTSKDGFYRIVSIKGNGEERKFLHLASGIAMVERYIASWGCADKDLLDSTWPAPFTAILPAGDNCPEWVGDTIALRIPYFPPLLPIIEEAGEPVISTSVNRVGEPPLRDIEEIARNFGKKVDLIVTSEEVPQTFSSTIVDFTGDIPVLVREGSYPWEA